ncbi:Disulfide-bond oxidoreductase YfcG [Aquimixticola soesokkakensis]|uniref:Disulfide-bond oxidoreductase YfcG n=1 Tax=Aquimixticola soesokkakensis TaxID=1519096 RepID=A0A1Y5S719_9RHOB|nr:glutathione S-transferase N-terminal domain-containing protein [Aquimixticola soesokkakensis]SLN31279.1 Disulfide-bond oxidoreductase YfcG [Aquimixticola soesokkakensis]
MTAPIELHTWATPNGKKVAIALEEMGLPYTAHFVNIGKGEQFDPAFLEIAPNNRIPAILDPDGPDGAPISVFESGAILQYLARKTGLFCGPTQRDRVMVDQWLMWQMGGLGPMAGQANHFLKYAPAMEPPQVLPYAQDRYRLETQRLLGVLERQLEGKDFVAGDFYSIADMAIYPWVVGSEERGQKFDDKPNINAWMQLIGARPLTAAGMAVGTAARDAAPTDPESQKKLFGLK